MKKYIWISLFILFIVICSLLVLWLAPATQIKIKEPKREISLVESPFYHYYDSDTLLLINFWATWCKPCLEKFPELNELQENKADKKFKVVHISTDKDSLKVKEFYEKFNYSISNEASIENYIYLDSVFKKLNFSSDLKIGPIQFKSRTLPYMTIIRNKVLLKENAQNLSNQELTDLIDSLLVSQ